MMNLSEIVPPEVLADLEAIDRTVSMRRHQTLGQLLVAWYGHGETLMSRRAVHLDDYVGMLSARDALEAVIDGASLPTRHLLGALTSYSDCLFFAGTVPDAEGILRAPEERVGWWWHRIPENYDAA
jgi:hypothetical protein